jgi:hypothetical protein
MAEPMDVINYLAPFASGAFGAGIVWGYVKTKITELDRRTMATEKKIECQVGQTRCDRMREECTSAIVKGMDKIEAQILDNRNYVTDRFVEIARFMGQHNGH